MFFAKLILHIRNAGCGKITVKLKIVTIFERGIGICYIKISLIEFICRVTQV